MNNMYALKEVGKVFFNRTKVFPYFSNSRSIKRWVAPTLMALESMRKRIGPRKPSPRNTFLEWNYDAELFSFQKRLGEEFQDTLLRQALTERSFIIKQEQQLKNVGIEAGPSDLLDNMEMSSQGERFIHDFTLQYLRHVLPRFPEEGILSIVEYLMSDSILGDVSSHIGTSDIILCSDFPLKPETLSNVFKAVTFALSESSGVGRASVFVRDFVITQISECDVNDFWHISDPIQLLNIICTNEKYPRLPEPRLIGEAGANTLLACYRVGLYLNKEMIGLGAGESINVAHEMAARDTLRRLFGTSEYQLRIPFDLELDPNESSIPNVYANDWCENNIKRQAKVTERNTE